MARESYSLAKPLALPHAKRLPPRLRSSPLQGGDNRLLAERRQADALAPHCRRAHRLPQEQKQTAVFYRDAAYLLTTDLRSSVRQLLQIYFERWQIEANHREEKDTLGVGPAQLWKLTTVPSNPYSLWPLTAPCCSLLSKPSVQSVVKPMPNCLMGQKGTPALLLGLNHSVRKEMTQQTHLLTNLGFQITNDTLLQAAAA